MEDDLVLIIFQVDIDVLALWKILHFVFAIKNFNF